jgi:hypothetical protein
VKSAKEQDAASKRASANRTSSASMQRSYLRQAESAEKTALSEGGKIADLSKQLAAVARDEGQKNKDLTAALKFESAAQGRADEKARMEREAAEKKWREQVRAEEIRRQRERLADEQRRLDEQARYELDRMSDQAAAASMVVAAEERLSRQISGHPRT